MSKDPYFYDSVKQSIITEINRVRADPICYIPILQQFITYFKENNVLETPTHTRIETIEGTSAFEEAIKYLKKQRPMHTLTFDERIYLACADHVKDIGQKGLFSHESSDGKNVSERLEKYLEWENACCENILLGLSTGTEAVVSMLVDDGVPTRIHREHIFRPEINYLGVAAGTHKGFRHIVVIDFLGGIRDSGKPHFNKITFKYEYPAQINLANNKSEKKVKKLKSSYQLHDDDAPDGTTEMRMKKETRLWDGKKNKVTRKYYTIANGSHHVVEVEQL